MKAMLTLAALAAAALTPLAGCGSSNSSSASAGSAHAAASGASTAASGGYRGYGSAATATTSSSGSAAPGAGSAGAVHLTVKHGKLGAMLAAGPERLTVYMFASDSSTKSTCNGACASAWPPVTGSSASAAGGAVAADLGTITRADGARQVTYAGHPLYYFSGDKDASDANGQGISSFGAAWYALAPSGSEIDNS